MALFVRAVFLGVAIASSPLPHGLSVRAADDRSISGDYVCISGCRLTDAPPSIAIDGDKADCMNELGGIYYGKALSRTSVSCFNKVGTLSKDGKIILWSDGALWRRR